MQRASDQWGSRGDKGMTKEPCLVKICLRIAERFGQARRGPRLYTACQKMISELFRARLRAALLDLAIRSRAPGWQVSMRWLSGRQRRAARGEVWRRCAGRALTSQPPPEQQVRKSWGAPLR